MTRLRLDLEIGSRQRELGARASLALSSPCQCVPFTLPLSLLRSPVPIPLHPPRGLARLTRQAAHLVHRVPVANMLHPPRRSRCDCRSSGDLPCPLSLSLQPSLSSCSTPVTPPGPRPGRHSKPDTSRTRQRGTCSTSQATSAGRYRQKQIHTLPMHITACRHKHLGVHLCASRDQPAGLSLACTCPAVG